MSMLLLLIKFTYPIFMSRLLIWEECYYGPITYSGVPPMPGSEKLNLTVQDLQAGLVSLEAYNSLGFQGGDRVQLLVNKMMLDNHVNVVGEGYDF